MFVFKIDLFIVFFIYEFKIIILSLFFHLINAKALKSEGKTVIPFWIQVWCLLIWSHWEQHQLKGKH